MYNQLSNIKHLFLFLFFLTGQILQWEMNTVNLFDINTGSSNFMTSSLIISGQAHYEEAIVF